MKLLSNKELQSKENAEATFRISRIKELRDEESKLRIQVTNAELEFQKMLIENQKKWEAEYAEHQREVQKMKEEVSRLEAEKLAASIPFEILKSGADEKVKVANEFLESVKKRESDAEELKELLEIKLSAVEDREVSVLEREKKSLFDEQRAISALKESNDAREKLSEAILQFNKDSAAKRTELQERETSLILKEDSLNSKAESLIGREKDLKDEQKRLRDGQDVLRRAWEELKRKQ
jgi:hypothetical protein